MRIEFLGGTGTVTGSKYLLERDGVAIATADAAASTYDDDGRALTCAARSARHGRSWPV